MNNVQHYTAKVVYEGKWYYFYDGMVGPHLSEMCFDLIPATYRPTYCIYGISQDDNNTPTNEDSLLFGMYNTTLT